MIISNRVWARRLLACSAFVIATPLLAQAIVKSSYRPPETVQQVAIPVDPKEDRIRLLIISGENSYEHDWTGVNNLLREQLQDTKRFDVRVVEDFDHGTLAQLKRYDVVLLNYSSRWNYSDKEQHLWSTSARQALYDYVKQGGGLVAYHSSFTWGQDQDEYHRMVGAVMDPGKSRRSPVDAFRVKTVDREHPVTAGLREYMWTFNEDMYTNMKFHPDAKIRVLVTARDEAAAYAPRLAGPKYPPEAYTPERLKAMGGVDADHPQVWVQDYGKGRVFSITLGHGPDTLMYDPLRTLMARGAEWAATGKVTLAPFEKAAAFDLPE
ncbi:MAG: ThuA domain-containing protein [Alphaproteobacteria bacterium HGW-Alphaproteobacteria-16]|nr:MAG: ThuA domain-containing protein [Alphaproteobacteria bacterium HGW-Alphaproteobacteria-16]